MKAIHTLLFLFLLLGERVSSQITLHIDTSATYSTPPDLVNGAQFKNFTDAISVLNNTALQEEFFPITFKVVSGQVFYEPDIVPAITQSGLSPFKKIVFEKTGDAANPLIIPAAGLGYVDYGISISGGDYIVFNGIDIRQGGDEERNSNNKYRIEFGYYIVNGSCENGATNNLIINCTITLNNYNLNTKGIYQFNSNESGETESSNSYNRYIRNEIYNSYEGIVLKGSIKQHDYDVASVISYCIIGDDKIIGCPQDVVGKSDVCGIRTENQGDITISYNEIQHVVLDNSSTLVNVYAINAVTLFGENHIYSNKIRDIVFNGPVEAGLNGVTGIQISPGNTDTKVFVYNHFISNIFNFSTGNQNSVLTSGIKVTGSNNGDVGIFHNSVYFGNKEDEASAKTALIYIAKTCSSSLKIYNNILKNHCDVSIEKSYCLFLDGGNLTGAGQNIYDRKDNYPNCFTGFYIFDQLTLLDWQTAVTNDIGSRQFEVLFNSQLDLHLAVDPSNLLYDCDYVSNPAIQIDIDQRDRDGTTTIGAVILRPATPEGLKLLNCSPVNVNACSGIDCLIPNSELTVADCLNTGDFQSAIFTPENQTSCTVQNWGPFAGSPDIYPLFAPGINYAHMVVSRNSIGGSFSECIVIKTPMLSPSENYTFSIYKNILPTINGNSVDDFRIILLHCSDYYQAMESLGWLDRDVIPEIPANSQTIYCESNVVNIDWEHVAINFTANSNYDMIWIRPKQLETNPTQVMTNFNIAMPQLVSNNHLIKTIQSDNNTITLSPSCIIRDGVYTWFNPQGLPITTQTVDINVNNTADLGTWTLKMELPGIVSTNNACSDPFNTVIRTVNIGNTNNDCIKLPTIR